MPEHALQKRETLRNHRQSVALCLAPLLLLMLLMLPLMLLMLPLMLLTHAANSCC